MKGGVYRILTSQKGRILQGMHFKATELSAAVHLCVWKTKRVWQEQKPKHETWEMMIKESGQM